MVNREKAGGPSEDEKDSENANHALLLERPAPRFFVPRKACQEHRDGDGGVGDDDGDDELELEAENLIWDGGDKLFWDFMRLECVGGGRSLIQILAAQLTRVVDLFAATQQRGKRAHQNSV